MSESSCSLNNETVGFDVLAAEVSIKLPSVAEPIINASIFRSSVDFLSKTRIYKTTLELDFQQNTDTYPVEAPDCNTVLTVEEVRLADIVIEDYKLNADGWIQLPCQYVSRCDGAKFEADVILGLSKDACELPKFVYERFGKGIINMVLADLYGMYGEPWYDLNAVRFYGGIGNQTIADAKSLLQLEESPKGIPINPVSLVI